VAFVMSRGKNLSRVFIAYDRNIDVNAGGASLESNFDLTLRRLR
jgi:hypothetical protein